MTASRSRKPRNPDPTAVTVEDWGHARARWMECPSGAGWVLFQPTSIQRAILGGFIPDAGLEAAARDFVLKGVLDPSDDDVTDEQWEQHESFRDWLIADCIKQPRVAQSFVHQAYEDDGEPHMPMEDRNHFWLAAMHGPALVTFTKPPGDGDESAIDELRSILGLGKFRPGAAGAQPAEDGPGAGGPAE